MSILDELRQKADAKKKAQYQLEIRSTQLENTYQDVILPKMQFLFDNLSEMVKYLNFLEEPLPVRHYSPIYPQFGTLFQKNYKINTDGRMGMADYQRLMQINVSFTCEAENNFSYVVSPQAAIDKEYSFLFERGLQFQQKHLRVQDQALFIVERKIPVRFQILVDYAASTLRVAIFNHENFQTFHKTVLAEQLDDQFLDAFLSYFMRRDKRFISPEITEEEKTAILDHIAPYYPDFHKPTANDTTLEQGLSQIAEPIKNIFTKLNKL